MLEEMCSKGPLMDPEELATEEVKKAREEALKEEKKVAEAAAEHNPSVSTKYVIVPTLPVPLEFGIDPDLCPGVNPIMEPSVKKPGEKVTKFYYKCKICDHQLQNQVSVFTHICKCLNIKLECPICGKRYDSYNHIDSHIMTIHDGQCDPTAILKAEAEGVVASLTK